MLIRPFVEAVPDTSPHASVLADCFAMDTDPLGPIEALRQATSDLQASHGRHGETLADSTGFLRDTLTGFADQARSLGTQLDSATRVLARAIDLAEKELAARDSALWPARDIGRARKALEASRAAAGDRLKQVRHFQRHAAWLLERFPEGRYADVQGLCKAVTRAEIAAADWSLTPGRYVGVAAVVEDEDFDFAAAISDVREELVELDRQAQALAVRIGAQLQRVVV